MSARPTFTSLNEETPPEQKAQAPAATQGSFMLSLADQPAAAPKGASKVNSFNVILLAMVLGSASLIMGMRKFGLANAAAAAEFKIDYTRMEEDPARIARQDRAIARLDAEEASPTTKISSKSVVVSPFFEPVRKDDSKVGVSDPEDLSNRAKAEAQRKREEYNNALKTGAGKLKLESIIMGVKPVARINKETVAVGDVIDEKYHVTAIKDRSVELTAGELTFTLELGGKIDSKGKSTKNTSKR